MNASNTIKIPFDISNGVPASRSSMNSFDPVLSGIQPQIEQKSLQVSMESNRESLERRLQLRRTIPELVNQGIYPKPNMPFAYAERCRQLEQAKTRDSLQKKLKHRPDRQCLVQHHILEDTHPCVDRSLQDKQRLLKKSKLQDNLNDLISHRPGPLDLLSKNILMLHDDSITMADGPANETDEQMFSDSSSGFGMLFSGSLDSMSFGSSFDNMSPNANIDDQMKHNSCGSYDINPDGHQLLYQSMSSPEELFSQPSPEQTAQGKSRNENVSPSMADHRHVISRQDIPPAPDITPLLMSHGKQQNGTAKVVTSSASFGQALDLQNNLPIVTLASVASTSSAYKQQKTQKKIRTKSTSKPKQIKFHEYKGPPSVVKSSQQASSKNRQTQPELEMLKLQHEQMLKWQITPKSVHSKPPTMSLIAPKPDNMTADKDQSTSSSLRWKMSAPKLTNVHMNSDPEIGQKIIQVTSSIPSVTCANMITVKPLDSGVVTTDKTLIRLEDMKVNELRAECRKLNISCTGSKQQLIEKIQMHSRNNNTFTVSSSMDRSNQVNARGELPAYMDKHVPTPLSIISMDAEMNANNTMPQNLSSVYIVDSSEAGSICNGINKFPTLHNSIPLASNFNNYAYNSCSSDTKPEYHNSQLVKTFNEFKKNEDDKHMLSSDEKIAQLERDLLKMKQEKDQLMQLLLIYAAKPESPEGLQALLHALPDQLALTLLKIGLNQQQSNIALDSAMKLLSAQNVQQAANNLKLTDIINGLQALTSPPQLTQHLATKMEPSLHSSPELSTKQGNIGDRATNLMVTNVTTKQNLVPQVQQLLFQNPQGGPPTYKEPPSFETHMKNSLNYRSGAGFVPSLQKNSNSFADLVDENGLNNSLFSSINNNLFQDQRLAKVDRNANQRLSQNLNGNSIESILKLWNMQNQTKPDPVVHERQKIIQLNQQQFQQSRQMQQSNGTTMDEVMDVLRTKSEFEDICPTAPSHHLSEGMDFFHGLSDPASQIHYDISFPFMMDGMEELQGSSLAAEEEEPHDSKMRTPQPDLELMDALDGIPGSSNLLSSFNQGMDGILFSHGGSSNDLEVNYVNQHHRDFKIDCLLDYDLTSFPSLQPQGCMLPFKAVSKS